MSASVVRAALWRRGGGGCFTIGTEGACQGVHKDLHTTHTYQVLGTLRGNLHAYPYRHGGIPRPAE